MQSDQVGADAASHQPPNGCHKPCLDGAADNTTYEMLGKLLGTEAASLLRQHLRESSRYDEDSFVYRIALMGVAQFRTAANMPIEIARLFVTMDGKLNSIARQLEATATVVHQRALGEGRETGIATRKFAIFSRQRPVVRQPNNVQSSVRPKQLDLGSRVCWMCVGMGIAAAVLWPSIYRYQQRQFAVWQQQVEAEVHSQQEQAVAETDNLRTRIQTEAEQNADDLLAKRFQSLVPSSYLLAQQLEKSARHVRTKDGQLAWEFTLSKDAGLLTWGPASSGSSGSLLFYMRDEPERWNLSKTSPSPSPGATRR